MTISNLDLSVLKSIVTNKKHALDFANNSDTNIFSPETWNFAKVVVGYIRTYKELPTLRVITEKLAKGSNDKLVDGIKNIWGELDRINVNDHEYRHDLEKIKNRFAEKQLLSTREALSNLQPGSIDVNKSIIEMQKTIQSIKSLSQV